MMEASIERGIKFYNTKRYEQALQEFRETDADPADNPELAYYLGLTLTQLERFEEGLVYLEQVVSTHSSFLHIFQARMILGYIYSVTGRFRLAEFEFTKLLEMGMESVQIYASLAYISYRQQNVAKSIELLEKALSIDPKYPNALNSLGFIYADEDIDSDKGLKYCRQAVNLRPDHAPYLDSLGWALYKTGDFAGAREQLRAALDLAPGNKEIARHLRVVIEKKP
jgi:tetratricopeptide (TPR) repeat protein